MTFITEPVTSPHVGSAPLWKKNTENTQKNNEEIIGLTIIDLTEYPATETKLCFDKNLDRWPWSSSIGPTGKKNLR